MSNVAKHFTGEAPVMLRSYNMPPTGNVPQRVSGNDNPPVSAAGDVKINCLKSVLRFDKGSCFGCTLYFCTACNLSVYLLFVHLSSPSLMPKLLKPANRSSLEKFLPNYTPEN